MTQRDLKQLAQSLIRQARMFKVQGNDELAASLMKRGKIIRSFAFVFANGEPALVPVRSQTRN